MTKSTKCPYKAERKQSCSHKIGSSKCIFKNPEECPLYNQWVVDSDEYRKDEPEPLKTDLKTIRGKNNERL